MFKEAVTKADRLYLTQVPDHLYLIILIFLHQYHRSRLSLKEIDIFVLTGEITLQNSYLTYLARTTTTPSPSQSMTDPGHQRRWRDESTNPFKHHVE